jgi:hypothetical protein
MCGYRTDHLPSVEHPGGAAADLVYLFFGLQIDPATLPPALMFAVGLGVPTTATKVLTG